jgi:hypothetical protein
LYSKDTSHHHQTNQKVKSAKDGSQLSEQNNIDRFAGKVFAATIQRNKLTMMRKLFLRFAFD